MEYTEKRWVPDTEITRKLKKVYDEKSGYILVDVPLKVSEFDNHTEHMREHREAFERLTAEGRDCMPLYEHMAEHMNIQLKQTQKEMGQPKWVLPKAVSKAQISTVKLPDPPTNTKARDDD